MISEIFDKIKCIICKEFKHPRAFKAKDRDVCRICWHYLTKEEKEYHN